MELSRARELAGAMTLPSLIDDDASRMAERSQNEDAIATLLDAWEKAPKGEEPVPFSQIIALADRNRTLCDRIGPEALERVGDQSLERSLAPDVLVRGVAALQHRKPAQVRRTAGSDLRDLGIAYVEAKVSGVVVGIDLETTGRYPDRGYIINLGFEFMRLAPDAEPSNAHAAYFGIPDIYRERGVPLERIHHITYDMLDGKTPFRQATRVHKALLKVLTSYPYLAHNAAFEDSWLRLHLPGYAEARKAGRIRVVDTRDICRRIDVDGRAVPRDQRPNALENWARRRGTLAKGESERHLGLEDVDLMLKTVQAEFSLRNMF